MSISLRYMCFSLMVVAASLLPTSPARADGYSAVEAVAMARQLAQKKEMPPEERTKLAAALGKVLASEAKGQAIQGVFVFRSGEGGFIVKFMKGDGLISFKGGKQEGAISISSWSAGAQVGGSATWGFGVVLGLKDVAHFGGEYQGRVRSAIAGNATTPGGVWLHPTDDQEGKIAHDLLLVLSGRGLSAGVGGEKLTIAPDW